MVNKDVLFQTFMKLESYDRLNIISDLLKFSSLFELEFFSTIIGSILQYQKLTFDALKEELNHDDNIMFLKNRETIDSHTRSKLISTISMLKVSNVSGATHIFEFLRNNFDKFKEIAHNNTNALEEILLIYQLANDHPAFNFSHCKEIYDWLKEIKSLHVLKDCTEIQLQDELIYDLEVVLIEKNDQQQYIYTIKVKWDRFECCIKRTLEDVYKFYSKLYQMFTTETKAGEICSLYLSYSDNLELSKSLMSKFLKDFLNSPQYVLNCDFVRQFFKPRITDKQICNCDSCRKNFNKLILSQDNRFENISSCSSPNNPSDNEEYTQSFDIKTEISSYSNSNYSSNSVVHASNLPLGVSINHNIGSDNASNTSIQRNRSKNRTLHSSGSSPINTPSDESEICMKNDSCKKIYRKISKEINKTNILNTKDLRTENWICQSSNSLAEQTKKKSAIQPYKKSDLEEFDENNVFEEMPVSSREMSPFYSCQIGNLLDWLKQSRLHKYHSFIQNLNFGEFHNLSEDQLNNLGFVDGASKKLITLIRDLKPTDINVTNNNVVNLVSRNRSNSNDSSRSTFGSCSNISNQNSDLFPDFTTSSAIEPLPPNMIIPQLYYQHFMSMPNLIVLSPNFMSNPQSLYSVSQAKQQIIRSHNTNS